MGVRLNRKKKRVFLLTFIYRLSKIPFAGKKQKLKLFLNLEWIFDRLAMEYSYKTFSPQDHPARICTRGFLYRYVKPTDTVLDLGCNTGSISQILAERAKHIVGLDYDKPLIDIAIQNNKHANVEFHHGEAYDYLKNNKTQFDVLILSHILEHLDAPADFLNKFKGFFNYIYIELPDFDKTYLNHYRQKLGLELVYTDGDHVNEFDRYELQALLKECNIEIVSAEYIYGIQRLWCMVSK